MWKKFEYRDMADNYEINMGAQIDKSVYKPKDPEEDNPVEGLVFVDDNGNVTQDQGYIKPAFAESTIRKITDERVYLYPIPLYSDFGVLLEQNPGWN